MQEFSSIFEVAELSLQVMFYLEHQLTEERKATALGEVEMGPAPTASLLFPTVAPKTLIRILSFCRIQLKDY